MRCGAVRAAPCGDPGVRTRAPPARAPRPLRGLLAAGGCGAAACGVKVCACGKRCGPAPALSAAPGRGLRWGSRRGALSARGCGGLRWRSGKVWGCPPSPSYISSSPPCFNHGVSRCLSAFPHPPPRGWGARRWALSPRRAQRWRLRKRSPRPPLQPGRGSPGASASPRCPPPAEVRPVPAACHRLLSPRELAGARGPGWLWPGGGAGAVRGFRERSGGPGLCLVRGSSGTWRG